MQSVNVLPTIKITISVKSQRWSRPRKDFIDVVTRQLGRACLFYKKGEIYIKECTYLLSIECENCGKITAQTRTQYKRAKHHFCSNKCQKEFQHKETHEIRKCLICGKEFEVSKRSTQSLCSALCQKEWQKLQIGEKNPRYTRKRVVCECCGKEVIVKNYKTENGQHLFCSDQCRRNWYSNVWSQQDDWKEKSRIRAVKILEKGSIGTNTKPQKIINDMLEQMNVGYINEKTYKYYSVDNYLFEYDLIIEVMGDFWHCNPLKYIDVFNSIQEKRIPKDKAKHTYIKNNHNIEILYLFIKCKNTFSLIC